MHALIMINKCIFVLFPERLQINHEGATEQVVTVRITGLNLSAGAIPEQTRRVIDTIQRALDNRNIHEDHTITVTVFVVINGQQIWQMSPQDGRWQTMNITNIYQREE